jgi:CelD/BcsL family acetyltransferase involved in cellulose biosynthesis
MPLREIADSRWLELVRRDPAATAFHHPDWTRAVGASYGFKSFLVTVETDGDLVTALPVMEVSGPLGRRRWVALPYTDSCAPLGDPDALESLVGELEAARVQQGVDSLEVRAPIPLPRSRLLPFVGHVVRLGHDADAVEHGYDSSVRRAIRRARRSGLVVRVGTSTGDLAQTFYELHVETRRRLGLPVQPQRFFANLWRCLGDDLCRVVLVESNGRPVAGALFLTWRSHLVYKYGASDSRYWSMRPNNLVFAETIRWACANGFTELDLGRTDPDAESLKRFKRGWGAEEQVLEYTLVGSRGAIAGVGSRPLIRGALRHAPRWVVRLTGEVIYRNAA